MRDLLDNKWEKKEKKEEKKRGKLLTTWLDKKGAKFAHGVAAFLAKLNESWQSWFKVITAQRAVKFRKMSILITFGIWYRLDTSSEKFLIFVLSG